MRAKFPRFYAQTVVRDHHDPNQIKGSILRAAILQCVARCDSTVSDLPTLVAGSTKKHGGKDSHVVIETMQINNNISHREKPVFHYVRQSLVPCLTMSLSGTYHLTDSTRHQKKATKDPSHERYYWLPLYSSVRYANERAKPEVYLAFSLVTFLYDTIC
jgi:hypothetical protein